MKPLNNLDRRKSKFRFISVYGISIILIIIVLSGFLQPAPAIKTVFIEKEIPARIETKTVYVKQENADKNNSVFADSLKKVVGINERKLSELNAYIQSQQNTILKLQTELKSPKQNKTVVITNPNKDDIEKLNKQITFLDWALRSQVSVTNTLTKENNNLKAKISSLSNK